MLVLDAHFFSDYHQGVVICNGVAGLGNRPSEPMKTNIMRFEKHMGLSLEAVFLISRAGRIAQNHLSVK